MIKIPGGLDAAGKPYLPDLRRLYWLYQPLLDPGDREYSRPAVVVAVPSDLFGIITVVQRSSTDGSGTFHRKEPAHGLSKDGWFSRVRPIQAALWTPTTAKSLDLLLDEETYSYVLRDFNL